MLGDDPSEWCQAILHRAGGDEHRRLLLVDGRPPTNIRIPIDADWFESLQLHEWDDDAPVYRSLGFVPRDSG